MKKYISIILILTVLLTAFILSSCKGKNGEKTDVQGASTTIAQNNSDNEEKTEYQDETGNFDEAVWKSQLKDFINTYQDNIEDGAKQAGLWNNASYWLININDDNVPELFVDSSEAASASMVVFCGKNGVKKLDTYEFSYAEGKNIFRDSSGKDVDFINKFYKIEGDDFVLFHAGEMHEATGEEGRTERVFIWDGTAVSQEDYKAKESEQMNGEGKSVYEKRSYDKAGILEAIDNY